MTGSIKTTALFLRPFELPSFNEILPAGEYEVETLIPGPRDETGDETWRPSVLVHLHSRASHPGLTRTLTVPLAELERAVAKDKLTGKALTDFMAANGGLIGQDDLAAYRVETREPIRGHYRGHEILGPPPPASSGVHIAQMLNILEGYDIGALGFGSPDAVHLLAEALKIAFADRAVATADPAFVEVPVDRLIDTTGAGDLFAAGFLHGYTHGRSLPDCARIAAISAAEVISHVGARPEVNLADLVARKLG